MAASEKNMRMLAVYHKGGEIAFISHLDIQRTLQRAMRRAQIPLAYSQGFNPHPKLSFASAVATGQTSDCEWFEAELSREMEPAAFSQSINNVMPAGLSVTDAVPAPEGFGSLSALTRAAEYEIRLHVRTGAGQVEAVLSELLAGPVMMEKKTKSGIRTVDIRPEIIEASVTEAEEGETTLRVLGRLQADGGLRADMLVRALFDRLDARGAFSIRRTAMYFAGDGFLPQMPSK